MKNILLSPAEKRPMKIAAYIDLTKKRESSASRVRAAIKAIKKATLSRLAIVIAGVSVLTAWGAAMVYDTTGSGGALNTLILSSMVALFALMPLILDKNS